VTSGPGQAIGAKPPRRVPVWLARLFVGEHGVVMMTEARGASNAKAKREFG
jgi:2-alkyl-3-oxoalkanoate reductase